MVANARPQVLCSVYFTFAKMEKKTMKVGSIFRLEMQNVLWIMHDKAVSNSPFPLPHAKWKKAVGKQQYIFHILMAFYCDNFRLCKYAHEIAIALQTTKFNNIQFDGAVLHFHSMASTNGGTYIFFFLTNGSIVRFKHSLNLYFGLFFSFLRGLVSGETLT